MVQHADIDHTGLTGVAGNSPTVVLNEIFNFPSMEGADGAQPEWWEESAGTATLTEEDIAGESITESWERGLKVVTTADVYAYQRHTYADEPRLKSGKVVSCRVAVWSVSGVTARVRIQDSNGSLGVATTTAAAWTILTVEAVTLTGTYVDLRLEVNNGTAYFVPLAFGVGDLAPNELRPRATRFRWRDGTNLVNNDGAADPATWTDVDCTAATSNLACVAWINVLLQEATSTYAYYVRRNGSSESPDYPNRAVQAGSTSLYNDSRFPVILDDGQIFEYYLDRVSGSDALNQGRINLHGWQEWE